MKQEIREFDNKLRFQHLTFDNGQKNYAEDEKEIKAFFASSFIEI